MKSFWPSLHLYRIHFIMEVGNMEKQLNKKYKDRVFRIVFRDKESLLELYNAVNGTQYEDPDALEIHTLDDVIYLGI